MNSGNAEAAAGDERIHLVTIDWKRGKYSREHQWHFAERLVLKVPDALAPAAYRDAGRLDPLKSYVATISSAHMLAWLHAAFSHEVEVESYLDRAEGVMRLLPDGRSWVGEVVLKPRVTFEAKQQVAASAVTHFHELAQ